MLYTQADDCSESKYIRAMTYYFFYNRIVGFKNPLNLSINRAFQPLTEAQTSFYRLHPQALAEEVRRCALNVTQSSPTPELEEIIDGAIMELRDIYCEKMGTYKDIDVVGAISSHYALTTVGVRGNTPFSLAESRRIIEGFNDLMSSAKGIYERHKSAIESATTKDVVVAELEQARKETEEL